VLTSAYSNVVAAFANWSGIAECSRNRHTAPHRDAPRQEVPSPHNVKHSVRLLSNLKHLLILHRWRSTHMSGHDRLAGVAATAHRAHPQTGFVGPTV